jgi:hypothetical protein
MKCNMLLLVHRGQSDSEVKTALLFYFSATLHHTQSLLRCQHGRATAMGELRHGTVHTTQKLNVDFFQPVYNTDK